MQNVTVDILISMSTFIIIAKTSKRNFTLTFMKLKSDVLIHLAKSVYSDVQSYVNTISYYRSVCLNYYLCLQHIELEITITEITVLGL